MADDKYNKKSILDENEEESGGEESGTSTSTGGAAGEIEFHGYLLGSERLRDDLLPQLPQEEIRRLLAVHGREHEQRVKEQKFKIEQMEAIKRGEIPRQINQLGNDRQFPAHPVLSKESQWNGISDDNVSPLPEQYKDETNNDKRKKLVLDYDLTNQPDLVEQPKFIPPRLTPK